MDEWGFPVYFFLWLSGKKTKTKTKNPSANAGDLNLIPESGRSLGKGNGNPIQYSCSGNPMDRGAWRAAVHAVTESDMTEQQDNNNTPLYGYITFVYLFIS